MDAPRTVTISVPPDLAREVDQQAELEGRSRSELYREAARQYLRSRDRWEQIFAYGKDVGRRLGVADADVAEAVMQERRARRDRRS
ncbi:MAG: ribbon-helix-helix protein, CopG family [Nitriliruptorales bacterium]|nr:ribbon-helix-helix protein, CopG family [Nitriliruptorales bacterium]